MMDDLQKKHGVQEECGKRTNDKGEEKDRCSRGFFKKKKNSSVFF